MTDGKPQSVARVGGISRRWRLALTAAAVVLAVGYVAYVLLVFPKLAGEPGGNETTLLARLRGDEIAIWSDACAQTDLYVAVFASTDGDNFDQPLVGPLALVADTVVVPPTTFAGIEPTQLVAVTTTGDGFFAQASGTLLEFTSNGIANVPDFDATRFDEVSSQPCETG